MEGVQPMWPRPEGAPVLPLRRLPYASRTSSRIVGKGHRVSENQKGAPGHQRTESVYSELGRNGKDTEVRRQPRVPCVVY